MFGMGANQREETPIRALSGPPRPSHIGRVVHTADDQAQQCLRAVYICCMDYGCEEPDHSAVQVNRASMLKDSPHFLHGLWPSAPWQGRTSLCAGTPPTPAPAPCCLGGGGVMGAAHSRSGSRQSSGISPHTTTAAPQPPPQSRHSAASSAGWRVVGGGGGGVAWRTVDEALGGLPGGLELAAALGRHLLSQAVMAGVIGAITSEVIL